MDIKLERNHSGYFALFQVGDRYAIQEWSESEQRWIGLSSLTFSREVAQSVLAYFCERTSNEAVYRLRDMKPAAVGVTVKEQPDPDLQSHHSGRFSIIAMGGLFFIVEWSDESNSWRTSTSQGKGFKAREAAEQILNQHCQFVGGCWNYGAVAVEAAA